MDFLPGGKALKLFKGASAKLGLAKLNKLLAKQAKKKAGQLILKDAKLVTGKFLKKHGVNPHALKEAWLHSKAQLQRFDIYRHSKTGELIIFEKGGKGIPIPTGKFIK